MTPFEGWIDGIPPRTWVRILAMDVGGATANNLEWAAICPDTQSLVFYDEVNKVTTDMRLVADLSLPKMSPEGEDAEYNFLAKVGDYENRVALADMGRYGINFSNAVKHNKTISAGRLSGYLHPNPKRPFPLWHPRAGELGAPLMFTTPRCKHLNNEIPMQKWKAQPGAKSEGTSLKDELDRSVKHDAVDCALYIVRLLPAPATVVIPKLKMTGQEINLQSNLYWEDVRRAKERLSGVEKRKAYSPSHQGGSDGWKSLLGFSLQL
jgi:hypothetical protein